MSFGSLALIVVAGLFGPALAVRQQWHLPMVLGELLAGIVLGPTLLAWLDAANPTWTFLADIGFALVMFVAGSKVPARDPALRKGLRLGIARAVGVGVAALALAFVINAIFGTGHTTVYAVLMASSSAAIVLPIVDSLKLTGEPVLQLLPQVAIADAACIVALPLAIDPQHALRAAGGALAVSACAAVLFVALRRFERNGSRARLHKTSERRQFALELRIQLAILFSLAALAVATHVSIMLAGFTFGLAVSAVGEPRRLAKQLFALTDGFFGPLFFVWLGASLNLRDLGQHPSYIGLGLLLGVGAVLAHTAMRLTGQPVSMAALAAAQVGVPVAAATLGTQLHLLRPGEGPAIVLGALVTIGVSVVAGAGAARRAPAPAPATPRRPRRASPPTAAPPAG
jgi:Kef-type K+ transport system membrane component KefB